MAGVQAGVQAAILETGIHSMILACSVQAVVMAGAQVVVGNGTGMCSACAMCTTVVKWIRVISCLIFSHQNFKYLKFNKTF
jgi:hypothetical protein